MNDIFMLRHRLLVASPILMDPNFYRAVVFVLEHNDDGTVGIVLNDPTDVILGEALDGWGPLGCPPGVVFCGGPVEPTGVIAVARSAVEPVHVPGFQPLIHGFGLIDLDAEPGDLLGRVNDLRLYLGCAGWSAGQLASEIAEGAWIVLDPRSADLMSVKPQQLWSRVLGRQGGAFTQVALQTEEPWLN
jgi:putative transcriptional regulator